MNEVWQHIRILDSFNWAALGATTLRAILILVLALAFTGLLRRLTTLFRSRITRHLDDAERVRRVETLVRVVRYVANVVVILVAGMLILSEVGVSIAPILGAAGVVGLAVGFGAQSLIKDYFTGFFLLAENQIRVGAELRQDQAFALRILGDLEMAGVDKWADSAVIVRCRIMVAPLAQWDVRREFLRRLKKAFDAENIEIPYPHLTVYPGQLKDGTAPALRVVQAEGT